MRVGWSGFGSDGVGAPCSMYAVLFYDVMTARIGRAETGAGAGAAAALAGTRAADN